MDVQDATASLEVHLLGRFLVSISGEVLDESAIKGRKARSLLKLLALQRQFRLVRDQATDALWPELDATAAAAQLYKALHNIRKAFSPYVEGADDWIELTDDLIRVVPPGGATTDLQRFEQAARAGLRDRRIPNLETAVTLYAGDLLPMDLYAEWTSVPREHYRQLYLDVLMTLAEHYERRGELSEAAEMLRLALGKDPVLESAHQGLMRIFARRGQPTRAFRQYDLCRDVLRRELDMEPSPETRKTLVDVRERRVSEEPVPAPVHAAMPGPMAPIVGRAAECAQLDRSLERLESGEGSAILISGGVGVGKTRLVQELIMRSRRRSFPVYSGSAQEGKGSVAYGPFVELFDAVLRAHPDLQNDVPVELGRLVPSFSGNGAPIPHADKLAAQGYLFAQIHRFLGRLSENGAVVIALEDLHAADEVSRELFHYLIRHVTTLPVLLAATTRDEPAEYEARIAPTLRQDSVQLLDLGPLTFDEHVVLLRQHAAHATVSGEAAHRLFSLSEGNPLFALELLQFEGDAGDTTSESQAAGRMAHREAPSGRIPASLTYVVEERLGSVSPRARRLLYVAAVIGRHVAYELLRSVWARAAFSDEPGLFEALEEVVRVRLLDDHGLDYSFRHALVREAIYESISENRRRSLHALVARRLVSMSAEAEEEPVEQIAYHFVRAGEMRQGAHYLVLAGERAEAAYAHEDALRRYREALDALADLDDTRTRRLRRDVLERVGDVYRACGRLEKSYDAYEEAIDLADDVPLSASDLVELHRKIALVAIFRTEMDRSARHLAIAFDLVGDDARARARLKVTRALHLWHLNELEEAYDLARAALDLAENIDAQAEASQACEILAMACLPLGRWEEGLEYEMQRQIYGWSPEIVVATDAHLCLWEYHVSGDQPFQQARTFMRRVAEQAAELGDLRCVAVCHYALGTMHLWRGESRPAVDELDASLELHERVGSPAGMAYALARKGVLHTLLGATDLGWQAIQVGIEHAERAAVRDHCLQRLYGVGIWNRLDAGDLEGARTLVEMSTELLADTGACAACALELYPWLAYFYLRTGDIDRAQTCQAAVSELAAMTGNPIGRAIAAMIESSLLVTEDDQEQAHVRRREAFELVEGAVTEATYSPVVHYLDRMVDQQSLLRPAAG